MIHVDRDPVTGYDLVMEVATMIPRLPNNARLEHIATDLGVGYGRVENACFALRDAGYPLRFAPCENGRKDGTGSLTVGCSAGGWHALNEAATRYFVRRYPELTSFYEMTRRKHETTAV